MFNSKCTTGKNCLRQRCYNFNSDCSSGQSCCSGNCTEGLTCIGKSCISERNCQAAEICCWGTCSKVKCKDSSIAYFVGPIAAFLVIVLIMAIFLVYRRRLDLHTSRAQIFSRARSASGRFFMFSAAKANQRAKPRAEANYWNRKWEAKDFEKV